MKTWAVAVVVLVLCAGPAWAFPVSLDIIDLNGGKLLRGDPVVVMASFAPDVPLSAGQLVLHQIRVDPDGTRTGGRQFDIVAVTGPGEVPESLLFTIENQVCIYSPEIDEVCSNVVYTPVYGTGWAWSDIPILSWSNQVNGALVLVYPAVPAGAVPTWEIQATVQ